MTRFLRRSTVPGSLEDAILQQWDECCAAGEFPRMDSDSHWAYGTARLSAFRQADEWLTVFEVLVYHLGSGDFEVLLCAYGNRLRRAGVQDPVTNLRAEMAARQGPARRALRAPLSLPTPPSPGEAQFLAELNSHGIRFPPEPDLSGVDGFDIFDDWWCQDPFDFGLAVCRELRRFQFTPQDYAEAGIDLAAPISGEPHIDRVIRVMRVLCDQLPREELFYPPALLLECLQRPAELPLLLRLEEWCNPGVEGIEKPSDSPCLRALARALAHNDPGLYQCSPELVNTHWSRWPRWLD